jgi:hypothetical protein
MAADVLAVPGRFILPSLRALHLDRGSAAAGIAVTKESGGERALPLIMTWCPDEGGVNTLGWAALAPGSGGLVTIEASVAAGKAAATWYARASSGAGGGFERGS